MLAAPAAMKRHDAMLLHDVLLRQDLHASKLRGLVMRSKHMRSNVLS